jgi:hypothetical protein
MIAAWAFVSAFIGQIAVDGDLADIRAVAQASVRDPVNDVCPIGRSGFDLSQLDVYYDTSLDAVFVGIDLMDVLDSVGGVGERGLGVPGDADGDGDPDAGQDLLCVAPPFEDQPGVGPQEFYWVVLDPLNGGGLADDLLAVYRNNHFSIERFPTFDPVPDATGAIALGTLGAPRHPTAIPDENPNTADIEVRIDHWSRYDSTPRRFLVSVVTGSLAGLPNDSASVLVDLTEASCASGTVGGVGTRVLRVDGNDTVVVTTRLAPIDVSLDPSPAGPSVARYALWVWAGAVAGSFDLSVGETSLGCTVGATPLRPLRGAQPFRCLRSPDLPARLCGPLSEAHAPTRAPWSVTRHAGFSVPITLTLQGVLEDAGADDALGFAVTNSVVLIVR